MSKINELLKMMISQGASDLHFTTGKNPMFRQSGKIEPLRHGTVTETMFADYIRPIAPQANWNEFEQTGDTDFAFEIASVARFRVNLFRQEHGAGAVFRAIPSEIIALETLGVPESVHKVAEIPRGLVLVTGPTGSGKSTTLAAIINKINEGRGVHIITLEDPIEFVHTAKRALLSQREIGAHAHSFSDALHAAVREDPDVILVGEMRDKETTKMALHSSETGVLVFGTLHTNGAASAIDRIINIYPPDEQDQVRSMLSQTLKAVVAQQLLPKRGGGRVGAYEVMFCTPAMSNMIREGKTHLLESMIQMGSRQGMIAMDDALRSLVKDGTVDGEDAYSKSVNKDEFRKFLEKFELEIGGSVKLGGKAM